MVNSLAMLVREHRRDKLALAKLTLGIEAKSGTRFAALYIEVREHQ